MYFECDCSNDSGDPPDVFNSTHRKARTQHTCCECGRTIQRGERYEFITGLWEGSWSTFKTCLGCERLRDRLCSHGAMLGNLANQIEPCIGFDYRTEPSELEDDDG